MYRRILLLLLGLMLAGTGWSWGQPGPPGMPGAPNPDHELGGFQERLMEIKRAQMGPALGVDQQKVNKLLEIDQRYKPMRRQMIMGMKNDWNRLQQLMNQPRPPEAEIQTILSNLKRRRLEMLNLQQRQGDEEMALLTPLQQARYLIYLRSLIREARSIKGGPGGPGGMSPMPPGGPREIPVSRPPQ